jgi:hypothetical protein
MIECMRQGKIVTEAGRTPVPKYIAGFLRVYGIAVNRNI